MTKEHQNVTEAWGLRCPRCACDDEIDIAAIVWVRPCPDGTDIFLASCGDHEWTDDGQAACQGCGFHGQVRDFTIDGGAS